MLGHTKNKNAVSFHFTRLKSFGKRNGSQSSVSRHFWLYCRPLRFAFIVDSFFLAVFSFRWVGWMEGGPPGGIVGRKRGKGGIVLWRCAFLHQIGVGVGWVGGWWGV
ncbi:hypothetical protein BO94DRAFT_80540 [Aspergillus sclerotioniger CBS 115572]|uniref:Transmembrane protein n=1 Tax=Aspergillus sclerotioniger CBS 115572 TaxID=1450535 RepID=A0A317WMV8_9EURO|nr:hypothetical protein BO94DRAFT_80540 [Aspergillus sclerotioniger CBS 115572]PWY86378.1 hypothetical protein BO94DRAFT_80540 [Aspergillus sclerotioniger CBS 115572]